MKDTLALVRKMAKRGSNGQLSALINEIGADFYRQGYRKGVFEAVLGLKDMSDEEIREMIAETEAHAEKLKKKD